jgi:hypothetical protein
MLFTHTGAIHAPLLAQTRVVVYRGAGPAQRWIACGASAAARQ